MPREIDSMLSSMRTRKQLTGSPRWALPRFREGRGGGLEAAGKHFVGVFDGLLLIAGGELQGHSGATLREVLKIEATIERLERVGRVELERTKKVPNSKPADSTCS